MVSFKCKSSYYFPKIIPVQLKAKKKTHSERCRNSAIVTALLFVLHAKYFSHYRPVRSYTRKRKASIVISGVCNVTVPNCL